MSGKVVLSPFSPASFVGRKENQSMIDGILYNVRQQKAEERAAQKAANIDSASVSSFNSTSQLLKEKKSQKSKSSKRNGTDFSVEKLNAQALQSQIRIGI